MSAPTPQRRLGWFALFDEIGPLVAVYALLFVDNGLTASQISAVFVLWAGVAIVLEIPSGALADLLDRRRLIAVGLVFRAVGISVWLVWPTFAGVMVGAALWALHSSLFSGAFEALVHDQLTAVGDEGRYASVMARLGQLTVLGGALSAITGGVLLALGGSLELLGWLTVALHVVPLSLITAMPDAGWVSEVGADEADDLNALEEWWVTLRDGVRELRASRVLVGLVGVSALLEALFVVDEYVPVLAAGRTADDALVPLFVLVVWLGVLAGGELAARRPALSPARIGLGVLAGAVAMMVAVAVESLPLLVLVGFGYAVHQVSWTLSDARLQERIGPRRRATVTSVRSFFAGILATLAFVVVGAFSNGADPRVGLMVVLVVLAVTGVAAIRYIPSARSAEPIRDEASPGADPS